MHNSRQDAAKLILRIPGSQILYFAHSHIKPSPVSDETQKILLEKFVSTLCKLLQHLLELHPSCYDQLSSTGIFDRLEMHGQKTSNGKIQLTVVELISRVTQLQEEYKQKTKQSKPKIDWQTDRSDPPPDDFHQLSIYPTLEDIFQPQMPYLRKNIITGQYKNGTHYLDIHFRLLREDFLQPLREAICQYISDDNRNTSFRNVNVRLYRNTILTGTICSHVGVLFSLAIDLNTLPKSIIWSNSRRLIYGNLLAATFDDFATSCFLLTVDDRSNLDKNGNILVRCQKELCDHKLMRIPPGTPFTLLETTSYFEAYRPILQAIQNIKDDQIPLEKYLLHCDKDVGLPAYFRENSGIDFQPILAKHNDSCKRYDDGLSDVKDLTTWPNAAQLGLDDSQYQALQLALTKAVALIQGPPGCGKTFLGVRLAELFYHNRKRITGCSKPILMICYTNHALDQFLSSIIQKLSLQPGEIVRVGGRSSHSQIEPYLIQKLRQQRRNIRSTNTELSEKYVILKSIKSQLDTCQKSYINCSQQLLNATQLLRVIDRQQFLQLIDPILDDLDIFREHWNNKKGGIYCCLLDEDLEDSHDDSSDDGDPFHSQRSVSERIQRMEYRIHCQKLNNLSEKDEKLINELIIQWLGAKCVQIIRPDEKEEVEDDGQDEFQEVQKNKKQKNKAKAAAVLREILSDPMISPPIASSTNDVGNNQNNLDDDDEEELRRIENIDNSYIPLTFSNPTTERERTEIDTEQLESMQYLLTTRGGLLSEDDAKKVQDLWTVNKEQRQTLYRYWLYKYLRILTNEWFNLNEQYDNNHQTMQELWLANDRLYMEDAFIIAMTTHCASRYQKVLKQIAPRICIVEEAAEVFESHIITAIGEGIEHLILIGDHIQLRPSPNVYTLAKHFNLDVSLFERLINNDMPSIQLCEQHRSIPIISKLTHHFYNIPIRNHESVLNRSPITGVCHPLYFINHSNPEENVSEGISKRNTFECNYIIQLANYLINQGYDKSNITILTTYLGQRQLISRTIGQSFNHLKGIQITVVDNYQGEENRIILLSLVRSNVEKRLGYLAVDNRICVALSRAQNAFYVIGNFHLLAENSATWKVIVDKIKESKLIGTGLPINCANHSDNQLICQQPNDFLKRPLGGCGLKCEIRLECGHQCPLSCHSTSHKGLRCTKPCARQYDDCDHQCRKECHAGTDCTPCCELITLKMPDCEHTTDVPCCMRKTNKLACYVLVAYTCPLGHQVQVKCCDLRNQELSNQLCTHSCDFTLECGHPCTGSCTTCFQGRFHHPCDREELIVYLCGHSHEPSVSDSMLECSIHQCMRYCQNRCKHRRCSLRCKLECDCGPCIEKCSRRFQCDHYCNGVCGEPCIDCFSCRDTESKNAIRDAINGEKLRYAAFVQLECGHLFKASVLDEHVRIFAERQAAPNGFFRIDYPGCPTCQWPLVKCKRYASLIKKIHNRIANISASESTLTRKTRSFAEVEVISLATALELPESVIKIVRQFGNHPRRRKLTELFLNTIDVFKNLSGTVSVERDKFLRAIYAHVEQHDSLYFTRQQWLDIETEYKRLLSIDHQATTNECLSVHSNQAQNESDDDDPFKLLPLLATPKATITDKNSRQSILSVDTTWNDFEKDRLICDGKWALCSKPSNGHLIWVNTITEQITCSICNKSSADQMLSFGTVGNRAFRGSYGRGRR
ncbi:unnamed protein product [Adineta ricciae]|uniref:NFX1-type zinc finger-containing protein 1 n=1 Tax=Adineta ricciae TaxID=249248 RepID=A0A814LUG0_ADIRI|nr:unnamed protein product [Adineta ricciae]